MLEGGRKEVKFEMGLTGMVWGRGQKLREEVAHIL